MKKFLLSVVIISIYSGSIFADESDYTSIFNGKNLDGWKCIQENLFHVADGAIVAINTKENPIVDNRFLIWQGGKPGDFDLKLKFKIEGDKRANSGIQFRGSTKEDGHVVGYQADIDRAGNWLGALYDEHTGRKVLAKRGQKTVIDKDGKRQTKQVNDAEELKSKVDLEGWNDYHISARGNRIILKINGVVTAEVEDYEVEHFDAAGILALQIHKGPPMTIRFKDIRIKQ